MRVRGLAALAGLLAGSPVLAQDRQVAGVVIQMQGPADQPELRPIVQVVDASGAVAEVPLHDDAEPPDDRAGDGVWSGIAMGLTGSTFTVRLPSGPETWMAGSFTVSDPWRPVVRFRPAPGGALVSFEPVALPGQGEGQREDPWLPGTQRASEAPSKLWLLLAALGLLGGTAVIARRLR